MTRRDEIIKRIESSCLIKHLGFILNGHPSPCHIWLKGNSGNGSGAGRGYGRISIDGITSAVHRVTYTHHYGYIPQGKQIDHLCNQRLCCNPEHLEMVTPKQNHKRRVQRDSPNLTLQEIIEM